MKAVFKEAILPPPLYNFMDRWCRFKGWMEPEFG